MKMILAHLRPHAHGWVAVGMLGTLFLIIEIPLVLSIFRNDSKDDSSNDPEK